MLATHHRPYSIERASVCATLLFMLTIMPTPAHSAASPAACTAACTKAFYKATAAAIKQSTKAEKVQGYCDLAKFMAIGSKAKAALDEKVQSACNGLTCQQARPGLNGSFCNDELYAAQSNAFSGDTTSRNCLNLGQPDACYF